MQRFYLRFLSKTSLFGQMVHKVTEFKFFRNKAQKSLLYLQNGILEILERFGGFYSEKFKFCDLLNDLNQKLVLRKKSEIEPLHSQLTIDSASITNFSKHLFPLAGVSPGFFIFSVTVICC